MKATKRYKHQFTLNAPLQQVAEFHKDTRTLKLLTPPPMFVTFNENGSHPDGTITDFNIWMGPLPIRWVAEISDDGAMPGFVDRQIKGPFEYWEHKHFFYQLDEYATSIEDQITARPSTHPFWGLISRFMWFSLPILFTYRKWRTRRELETEAP